MADDNLGFITLSSLDFVPENYAPCNGSLLQIKQYPALYSLLSIRFGGDGKNTFALPKLESPFPNCRYIICIQGYYPIRQ